LFFKSEATSWPIFMLTILERFFHNYWSLYLKSLRLFLQLLISIIKSLKLFCNSIQVIFGGLSYIRYLRLLF
jgi:hypothetical protein